MYDNFKHKDLTAKIIRAFYTVYNKLGYGFLEKVYENAMIIELNKMGLLCKQQCAVEVFYEGCSVGLYKADILVEQNVILELKAAEDLCAGDEAQLTNYLRATDIEVGLLLNFGRDPQCRRRVFENIRKNR